MQDQTPLHRGGKTVRLAVVNPRLCKNVFGSIEMWTGSYVHAP